MYILVTHSRVQTQVIKDMHERTQEGEAATAAGSHQRGGQGRHTGKFVLGLEDVGPRM